MLIYNDSSSLGDLKLDPTENLAKLKEENYTLDEKHRLPGQNELVNQEANTGDRMYWTDFLRKLQSCNPRLLAKDGIPGNIALYRPKRSDEREELPDYSQPEWYRDHTYVAGFPKDWLPEYSSITLDARGMPHREVKGWRSVLMALVTSRACTYQEIKRHFGEPERARGWRWHDQLRNYKG